VGVVAVVAVVAGRRGGEASPPRNSGIPASPLDGFFAFIRPSKGFHAMPILTHYRREGDIADSSRTDKFV